jgi:hypothetical protein
VRTNSLFVAWLLLALTPTVTRAQPEATKGLDDWFSPSAVSSLWTKTHCDLEPDQGGALRATLWKGYGTTGFETSPSPAADWSAWKSFRFDVENPYGEPFSVFVRLSNHSDHPVAETYTGGTFDGYVVGPGHSSVQISLETMQSREERAVDPSRIAYVGIFFQPLFLRDGMDLKFTADRTFRLSHPRLSRSQATLQKQPYGDLLSGRPIPQ